MDSRPVGVYHNPICPTVSHLSSILQDGNLYQPGGVSYGVDTSRPEYEMIYLSYLPYPISPIYPILPIIYPKG